MDSSIVQNRLSRWISTSLIQGVTPEKTGLTLFPTPGILLDGIEVRQGPFAGCRIRHARIALSPLSLLMNKNKITRIHLEGVTLTPQWFASPNKIYFSDSPRPSPHSRYTTDDHKKTVMGQVMSQVNNFLPQLMPYVDPKALRIDITDVSMPWFDQGDLHLDINLSKKTIAGTLTLNAPALKNLPIHEKVTAHGVSTDQLTGSFSFTLKGTEAKTQKAIQFSSPMPSASPILTGEAAFTLLEPIIYYTKQQSGTAPTETSEALEASTTLGIDRVKSTLSFESSFGDNGHGMDLSACQIEIHCGGENDLVAAYRLNEGTTSLSFSGNQLDAEHYGLIFKDILPQSAVCNHIFNILQGGTVDELTVQFDAFNPETMTIEGRLHDGVVAIPGTDLVASNLTGHVIVEKGILKAIIDESVVRNSTKTMIDKGTVGNAQVHGGISVALIDQRHPYDGTFDISTGLLPLHGILKSVITHHGIADTLKRIDSTQGELHGIFSIQGDRNGTPKIDVNADVKNLKLMDPRLPKQLAIHQGKIRYFNRPATSMEQNTPKTKFLTSAPSLPDHGDPSDLPFPRFKRTENEAFYIQTIAFKGINGQLGQSTMTNLNATMTLNIAENREMWTAPLTVTADEIRLDLKECLPWLSRILYPTSINAQTDKSPHSQTERVQQILDHTEGIAKFEAPHFYGWPTKKETWQYHLAGRVMDAAISSPHDTAASASHDIPPLPVHKKRPKGILKKKSDRWTQGRPQDESISDISFDFSMLRSEENQALQIDHTEARINKTDLLHDWIPREFIKDLNIPFTLSKGVSSRNQTGRIFQGDLDFENGLRLGIKGEGLRYAIGGNLMGKLHMEIKDSTKPSERDLESDKRLHLPGTEAHDSKETVARIIYDSALLPTHFPLTLQGTLDSNTLTSLFQKESQTVTAMDHLLQGKRFTLSSSVKPHPPSPLSMNGEGENTPTKRHAQALASSPSDYTIYTESLTLDYILDLIDRTKALTSTKASALPPFPIPPFTLETNLFILNRLHFSPFRAYIDLNDTQMISGETAKTITIDTMMQCTLHPVTQIRITPGKLDISLTIKEEKQNIEPLISCFYDGNKLMEGTYTMEASLKTALLLRSNVRTMNAKAVNALLNENLNGTIHITSEKGRIFRLTLLSRILSLINVGELMAGNLPDIEQNGFAYDTIEIDGTVEGGRITLQKAVINGLDMTLIFMGWIDPFHDTMALTCLVAPFKTADSIIKNIPVLGKMFSNRLISIPVKAWGAIHDPELMILHPSDVGLGLIKTMENILKTPFELIKSLPQTGQSQSKSSHTESNQSPPSQNAIGR